VETMGDKPRWGEKHKKSEESIRSLQYLAFAYLDAEGCILSHLGLVAGYWHSFHIIR
jgi:hypothetical protein